MSSSTPAPLLRDYIDIPERTSTSDFVLKLADSVADADATLRDCSTRCRTMTSALLSNGGRPFHSSRHS